LEIDTVTAPAKACVYHYLTVRTNAVTAPDELVRDVDTSHPDYLALKASILERGQRDAIEVYATGPDSWRIVDGMHRFTALQEIKATAVNVKVRADQPTEVEALTDGLRANIERVEQRPVACAKALQAILDRDPGLTLADLGRMIGRPGTWVAGSLKLAGLEGAVAEAVDRGQIPLATGQALALLHKTAPESVTDELLDRAKRLPAAEVVPEVKELAKGVKSEAARIKRTLPRYRPLSDATAEWHRAQAQEVPCYTKALAWVLRQDEASLAECLAGDDCPLFQPRSMVEVPANPDAPQTVSESSAVVRSLVAAEILPGFVGKPIPPALWHVALANIGEGALANVLPGHATTIATTELAARNALRTADTKGLGVSTRARNDYLDGKKPIPLDLRQLLGLL
jgi:ParB-like chromosome segregation protein Spo0J